MQVIRFLLALLPHRGPDDKQEDDNVLEHLNVQLSAPLHGIEANTVADDHKGVHTDDVDPHETFLKVSIVFRL